MTIKKVKTAVNNVITQNGGSVYSSETDEGFKKPAFFVNIFPTSIDRSNTTYETVRMSVEVQYVPNVETDEECIETSEEIAEWFYNPIEVDDRKLFVQNLEFSIDGTVLYTTFDIEFMKLIDDNPPKINDMEKLKIREEVNTNGITQN